APRPAPPTLSPYSTLFRSPTAHSPSPVLPRRGAWSFGLGTLGLAVLVAGAVAAGFLLFPGCSKATDPGTATPVPPPASGQGSRRSEEHTSELQSPYDLVYR